MTPLHQRREVVCGLRDGKMAKLQVWNFFFVGHIFEVREFRGFSEKGEI